MVAINLSLFEMLKFSEDVMEEMVEMGLWERKELPALLGHLDHPEWEWQGPLAPGGSEALLDRRWEEWYTPGGEEQLAQPRREQSSSTTG